MAGRTWTPEQKAAASAKMKARKAALEAAGGVWPTPKTVAAGTATKPAEIIQAAPAPQAAPRESDEQQAMQHLAALAQQSISLPKEPDPSAPPPNLFNGFVKKLDVFGKPGTDPHDPIPGYQLYWFNDEGFTISQAKASGWMHVQKEEVALNDAHDGPGNNDLGGNVRRMVSRPENPIVTHAYLMKKPNWLHELHLTGPDSIEQKVHQKTEAQLRAGTAGDMRADDRRYSAGNVPAGYGSSTLPPINLNAKN